jgi:uncharacterized protein (DUF1778 family)
MKSKVTLKATVNRDDYQILREYAEGLGISLSAFMRLDVHRTAESIREQNQQRNQEI